MKEGSQVVVNHRKIGGVNMALARRWAHRRGSIIGVVFTVVTNEKNSDQGGQTIYLSRRGKPAGSLPSDWLKEVSRLLI